MFGRAAVAGLASVGRAIASRPVPITVLKSARFLAPVVQKRYNQVEVFGPFDPPAQLTFKQVEERVLKAIRAWDRFPADKAGALKMDAQFASDLGFDSLDHVELVMSIEDEFGFEIPLADAEKLKTPRDVFKFICEREDVFE